MNRFSVLTASFAIVLLLVLAVSVGAATGTKADRQDAKADNIQRFDLTGAHAPMKIASDSDVNVRPDKMRYFGDTQRRAVGSATSPNVGPGIGESISQTWDDFQVYYPVGRHIDHYWNGETGAGMEVEVHFVYEQSDDTLASYHTGVPNKTTGYNVYVANGGGSWPRAQDLGCQLQASDSIGTGATGNMAIRPNGLTTIIADTRFFSGTLSNDSVYQNNMVFYQLSQWNCTYDPRSGLGTSSIDSSLFQAQWSGGDAGTIVGDHALYPIVATQVDGGDNVVTHVLLAEENNLTIDGSNDYADDVNYRVYVYFRKVGDGSAGTWSSGTIIDTIERNFADMVVDPWGSRLVIAYSNPSLYGALLNNGWDKDCWYRESVDYGVNWAPETNFTNYLNALTGEPHFSMYYEVKALYSSDGNLHILFQQTPASLDPYFDGYNWADFNQDIAHWDRYSGDYVRVANGTYMNDDYLTGSINTIHCGFGGDPATYSQFFNISECDNKLFATWGQTHTWANEGDYILSPTLLSDCAYTGERLNMANWEIMMSIAQLNTPSLWDEARHVSNTFTPDCGLPGDPDATGGVCGNEYKPYAEHYGLDETGMALTWPAGTLVDMTPDGDPAYSGNFFLNMEYMDDQFPGMAWSLDGRDPNGWMVLNSMKWIRLACVEPVEASIIETKPSSVSWPDWVELGASTIIEVTVVNQGNVMLNVTEIGYTDGGGGWMSVSANPSPGSPFQVTAGIVNKATFDITIDASAVAVTSWLDGEVWLKSDAANLDSISIPIHLLAADEVEPVNWDTVITHVNMFDIYFPVEGACVALAVGNTGDLGWGAGSGGQVNLDYVESELECGTRARDGYYLIGASVYTIMADDAAGTNAELTQSFNDANQADETGMDPVPDKGSLTGGLTAGGEYDSTYTGKFVNRDTTIAFERIVYGPRPQTETPGDETINFMVVHTKVYSGDGQAHNHVTIGNVVDWDIPAEEIPENISGVSPDGTFLYMRGTDTTTILSCQPNANRWATEAFAGGYTSAEWEIDNCVNDEANYFASTSMQQLLMTDTTHYRDGTDLVPDQPNPLLWWEATEVPGLNGDVTVDDQAIWLTYKQDHNLTADDTLHFWTILTTVRDGSLADLQAQVDYAKIWYMETVRGCIDDGCCEGRVGDANGSGADEPTIGDISVMIDAKFITGNCVGPDPENPILPCLDEADINQSAPGPEVLCSDVTIGDISYLIDYLFITGPLLGLNDCL